MSDKTVPHAPDFRCGFVAIAGRANVGKSTLLNAILGTRISIVTPKAQTTRHRIVGVHNRPDAQIIFVDTPGIHRDAPRAINRYMNRAAFTTIADADVVLMVVEPMRWTDNDEDALARIVAAKVPVILLINKVDLVKHRKDLLPFMQTVSARAAFAAVLPVSATRGTNLPELEAEIVKALPVSVPLYPEGQVTDRGPQFMAAEVIREKLMWRLRQELPYGIAVEIEEYADGDRLEIGAVIWVERPGQKKIVIGAGGKQIKEIGIAARRDLAHRAGKTVDLRLWVRQKSNWSDDTRALRQFGIE